MFNSFKECLLSDQLSPTFRAANGSMLTKSLFWETSMHDHSYALYSLTNSDKGPYRSLQKLYIACNDPTEAEVARLYFEGWEQWQALCNANWFKPYLSIWRDELEASIKSKALAAILQDANNPESKTAHAAN